MIPLPLLEIQSVERVRTDEASMHDVATSTHPSTDTEFRSRIQQITLQLQKATSDILKLYGSDSTVCSNPYRSTSKNTHRRTSSLVQHKMYGRVAEKNSIIKLITGQNSDAITVVPIVGIGGIGKTALAQLLYNDQVVKNQFELRIWVWVTKNFDEVRLTREILDFVYREKHEGISSFAKLQEILIGCITSKRFLLILDDVWDNTDDNVWNKLLAPLKCATAKGNVILVTTRKLSVAKRLGTLEPFEVGALQNDDFRLLFKACAFGDDQNEEHPSLNIIGQQIEEKLHGNPLAAESAGMLLRDKLTIDHWSSTLKKETWKSLKLNNSIMNALKLSYDDLPHSLQQCLLYCSIFPKKHQFLSNELVSVWISQGFVRCDHPTRRLEDIGRDYLSVLCNSGFFVVIESYNHTTRNQTCYVMPALMHDFVRLVSRTEYAVIDGSECNEMLPTIRHLSIVTDSSYHERQSGNIINNEKFEDIFQSVKNSVRKLRTLLLIGKCDDSLFLIFQKAQCLRMLQISATYTDLDFFLHNNSTHLRYLKRENNGRGEALPAALNKSFHLQVLDVGHPSTFNSMNGLVSMRHLSVKMGAQFMDRNSICFGIRQLQPMSDLVHLRVDELQNVSRAEACGTKLRDKQQLETLHLSWTYSTLLVELEESGLHSVFGPRKTDLSITERDVLEGLEPYHNLKHLRICGCIGATSPAWLGASVTSLQTLNLEDCGEWQTLPSLQRLPFLTKLKLRNMCKVIQVSISSSLEELVLMEMPKLRICSCNSLRELNSSLKVLKIENCEVLENFTLFESCEKLKIEHKSWLPRLNELTVHGSHLKVLILPATGLRFATAEVVQPKKNLEHTSTKAKRLVCQTPPQLHGLQHQGIQTAHCQAQLKINSCASPHSGELEILECESLEALEFLESLGCLRNLGVTYCHRLESIPLRSCAALEELEIAYCDSLRTLEGFESLGCLRDMEVRGCPGLPPYLEYLSREVDELCPQLERLLIDDCSFLTASFCKHLNSLQRLTVWDYRKKVTGEQESELQLLTSLQDLEFRGCLGVADLPMGLHNLLSLKKLVISFYQGISRLQQTGLPPSLEELEVWWCSHYLNEQCRALATTKLRVQINGKYVK
ncbi:hypothetical protein ACP4OV_026377 [Aristida adscensionis]